MIISDCLRRGGKTMREASSVWWTKSGVLYWSV